MIKIYYVPGYSITREYRMIQQGLINNPRVELVKNEKDSDFIFFFYYRSKHKEHYRNDYDPEKTVLIDYHDGPNWYCQVPHFVYFKRSWVNNINKGNYTARQAIEHPSNMYPLTMAIMDEFISDPHFLLGDIKRDIMLSCTLRSKKRHFDRENVLNLLRSIDIRGKKQIGELNRETMYGFDSPEMREYFRLLRRSRIVVTCNPSKQEGDHRTWEAFANGALVFVDRTLTPLAHPFVDGKHCIFYDLSDKGLEKLKEKILWYLELPREVERIAKTGHEFAMRYHRASIRIDEILKVIT